MKITIDFEDGTEIQEHWLQGADRVISRGAWVTLRFKHPATGDIIFNAEIWDKNDNPVVVNRVERTMKNPLALNCVCGFCGNPWNIRRHRLRCKAWLKMVRRIVHQKEGER